MQFDTLLSQRYSCRGFLPQPVERATIERILGLAQKTPSWCNAQPWHITISSGAAADAFRDAMLKASDTLPPQPDFPWPVEYTGLYQARRRACGFGLYDSVGVQRGDRAASARQARENFRLFGAPHVAIVTTEAALGVYGAVDCGAYVSNFMLAARSLGVASIAQRRSPPGRAWCASASACRRAASWCAASRSASRIRPTRRTASAPGARRSAKWFPGAIRACWYATGGARGLKCAL